MQSKRDKIVQDFLSAGYDEGRAHDLANILQRLLIETNPQKRRALALLAQQIKNESRAIKDMRKQLIKEMRNGKAENVRDINAYVASHSKWRNDD